VGGGGGGKRRRAEGSAVKREMTAVNCQAVSHFSIEFDVRLARTEVTQPLTDACQGENEQTSKPGNKCQLALICWLVGVSVCACGGGEGGKCACALRIPLHFSRARVFFFRKAS
jgi:hypothetical protein